MNVVYRFLRHLLLAGALALLSACGDADEDNVTLTIIDCMQHIRADYLSTPDCRQRAPEICYALSRDLSIVAKARLAFATAKGVASDLGGLAGIDFEPWNHGDCVVVQQDICQDLGPYFPCQYESCLAEITEKCEKYHTQ